MNFTRYPVDRLGIESIASRLAPLENAFRKWLMAYTISEGQPFKLEQAVLLGIGEGDLVQVATPNGAIRARANLDSDLRRDCLRMTHGWRDANTNELTSFSQLDPISGFPWMRALPARIEKIEA